MTVVIDVSLDRERWGRLGPLTMLSEYCTDDVDIVNLLVDDLRYLTLVNDREIASDLLRRPEQEVTKEQDSNEAIAELFGDGLLTASGDSWREQRGRCTASMGALAGRGPDWPELERDLIRKIDRDVCFGPCDDTFGALKRVLFEVFIRHVLRSSAAVDSEAFTDATDTVLAAARNPDFVMLDNSHGIPEPASVSSALASLDTMTDNIFRSALPDSPWLKSLRALDPRVRRQRITTLLLSGHETTALTATWLLLQLAREERAQALLRSTHDVDSFVLESLRLTPPVYGLGRVPAVDLAAGSCRFAAGSNLLISVWTMQRRARYFERPLEFRPSRWRDGSCTGSDLLSFGAGARRCLGARYAMELAGLIVMHIVSTCRIVGPELDQISPVGFLTVRPSQPVELEFEPIASPSA